MAVEKPNYEARVGVWSIIALILLLYGWSWLKNISLFHPPQRFAVHFHDIAGLNNNAPVNVNGVRVGTVEKIALLKKGEVLVSLRINSEDVVITRGSAFTIQTLGMVGAKYIEITLPDSPNAAPVQPDDDLRGQDPVRVELVMNRIATNLGNIDFSGVEKTVSSNMERIAKAADSVQDAAHKFGDVAADAKGAASSANKFFSRGSGSFDHIDAVAINSRGTLQHINVLADDWSGTSKKVNKILDNPALTSDLKETMDKAREAASSIQATMAQLKDMVGNKDMRADLLSMLERLNQSTENVYKSVQIVRDVSGDQGLRSDVRNMISQAHDTMNRVNNIVSDPKFGLDLKGTIQKVKQASEDVSTVSRQLDSVLVEKHVLWKGLTGRFKKVGPDDAAKGEKIEIMPQKPAPALKETNEKLADPQMIPVTK